LKQRKRKDIFNVKQKTEKKKKKKKRREEYWVSLLV
jgi:hypothetical protein